RLMSLRVEACSSSGDALRMEWVAGLASRHTRLFHCSVGSSSVAVRVEGKMLCDRAGFSTWLPV
ncbi:hypothetical protein CSUI_008800, partial [Cystoisospora suis]